MRMYILKLHLPFPVVTSYIFDPFLVKNFFGGPQVRQVPPEIQQELLCSKKRRMGIRNT